MSLLQKYADFLDENEALKKENAELKEELDLLVANLAAAHEDRLEEAKSVFTAKQVEIPELLRENAALREDSRMLEWLLDNCSTFVTVDHTTGEPEIYIIEASREAIQYELEKEME